jgi:alginate O-acetyltransferase complex protein AlgJ
MESEKIFKKLTKLVDISFITIIFLLIAGLNLNTVFKFFKDYPSTENRSLAKITIPKQINLSNPLPLIEFAQIFPSLFDFYFSDRFSFRNKVIQGYSSFKFNVFDEGNKGAIKGADGWLFGGIEDIAHHHKYCYEFSKDLQNHSLLFKSNAEFLKTKGISYYVFSTPKKEIIYPEYLPKKFRDLLCGTSRLDIFIKNFVDHNSTTIINPNDELLAYKNSKYLFYKTDTHWNEDAAFIATTKLFKEIKKNEQDLKIPTLSNFEIYKNPINNYIIGDISLFMSIPWNYQDASSFNSYAPLSEKNFKYQKLDDQMQPTEEYRFYETYALTTYPKYRVNNPKALNNKRVLMIGDSFAWAMTPFLTETFTQVDYISLGDDFNVDKDVVSKVQPDIIIHQFLEKKL